MVSVKLAMVLRVDRALHRRRHPHPTNTRRGEHVGTPISPYINRSCTPLMVHPLTRATVDYFTVVSVKLSMGFAGDSCPTSWAVPSPADTLWSERCILRSRDFLVYFCYQCYHFFVHPPTDGCGKIKLNPFTTGNPFWGQNYLDIVWGGVRGL